MQHLTGLDHFLWVAGLVGHIVLLGVLWRKRRVSQFPFFTLLITLYIVRTLALFFIHRYSSGSVYFNTYWSLAIIDVVFQLLLLFEAATQIFRPTGRWAVDVRSSFLWILGGSAALAAALTWLAVPETKSFKQTVVLQGDFFASVLMSELFVGMIVLAVTTGLPWRTHVGRIVQGWGVYAIVGFLIGGLQSYFGLARRTELFLVLSHLQMIVYLACLMYWIVTLAKDAPEPRPLPDQLNRQLLHLNERTALALGYLRPRRRT